MKAINLQDIEKWELNSTSDVSLVWYGNKIYITESSIADEIGSLESKIGTNLVTLLTYFAKDKMQYGFLKSLESIDTDLLQPLDSEISVGLTKKDFITSLFVIANIQTTDNEHIFEITNKLSTFRKVVTNDKIEEGTTDLDNSMIYSSGKIIVVEPENLIHHVFEFEYNEDSIPFFFKFYNNKFYIFLDYESAYADIFETREDILPENYELDKDDFMSENFFQLNFVSNAEGLRYNFDFYLKNRIIEEEYRDNYKPLTDLEYMVLLAYVERNWVNDNDIPYFEIIPKFEMSGHLIKQLYIEEAQV